MLKLVFAESAWRAPSFALPKATCFPMPSSWPGTYAVGLTTVQRGSTSSNLSLFSGVLAGSSAAGGVVVTP